MGKAKYQLRKRESLICFGEDETSYKTKFAALCLNNQNTNQYGDVIILALEYLQQLAQIV